MYQRKPLTLSFFSLVCIVYGNIGHAIKVDNILTQSDFYQTLQPNGEYMFQFDKDEIFHVDLESKEVKWRLPQFGEVSSFESAAALQDINVLKFNLDIYEKRSNYTKAKSVAQDDIHVFPEKALVLGEPATLVCLATKFFPPIIKMSWLKNNQPVTDGVSETIYYPARDGSFSRFLYLSTIPEKGDVYTCSVEHDGLSVNPTNKFWNAEVPSHVAEISGNIICGLGLAYGIAGIVVGIALICKGKKTMNQARNH